ncbi:MAG: amidohydrolase family protein [Mogibacterium sp.]|nr:amidohydrolase family protein [Mogibacterium sp.]
MRFYTKDYYTLMMSLGSASLYEPVIDKDYTDEEIEELYQKALDRYVEEERASYDEPPEIFYDEDGKPEDLEDFALEMAEYESRPAFDEEEAASDFEDIYKDNLENPDEDIPQWVRETVDPRILAMYCMPEKTYRKLVEEDEANEERFDALDERADEALEEMREVLPEEYEELMDNLDEMENTYVISFAAEGDEIELALEGWDEEGEEVTYKLRFDEVDIIENEGIEVHSSIDEDGDLDSDCEYLYSELYIEDGRPEVHLMFDNNGLKYLTFRCSEAYTYQERKE